jgi:hypothetical protein
MDEDAKLQAEWARSNQWGRQLARKKAVATIVSTTVFGFILLFGLMLGFRGLIAAFILGIPAGMAVRRALWPKGQFA